MLRLSILILSLATCSNPNKCVIEESEFIEAIQLLYDKDILSISKDEVTITINSDIRQEFNFALESEIKVGSKRVRLGTLKKDNHWLLINQVKPSTKKENRLLVFFKAVDGAYTYSGEISFDCYDGKYSVADIHFVSAIN